MERFSEDLDCILIKKESKFNLFPYLEALEKELYSFGLTVEIKKKNKTHEISIRSAFLKANTKEHSIKIGAPESISEIFQLEEMIKIKLEIDISSCDGFNTETKGILFPIPFLVRTLDLPSLFAGKLHAILCRSWGKRVKGRDWFDQRKTPVNLAFLENKMRQTGHYPRKETLEGPILYDLLSERIQSLDIDLAKVDRSRFITNNKLLEAWSRDLFLSVAKLITT